MALAQRAPRLANGRRIVRASAVMVFGTGLALSGARVVGTRLEPILLVPVLVASLVGWLTARLTMVARVACQVVAFVGSGMIVTYASDGTAADFAHGLLARAASARHDQLAEPEVRDDLRRARSADLCRRGGVHGAGHAHPVARAGSCARSCPPWWRSSPSAHLTGSQWAPVLCAAVGAFLLLWIGFDDRVASMRAGAWLAVLIGVATLAASLAVAISHRADPRHTDDVNRELSLLDPLSEVAAQLNAAQPTPIYRVESAALDQLHRWRTAALDVYNGESWSADGRLTPVGSRLGSSTGAEPVSVRITALSEDTVVWATPGALLRTGNPVETDPDRRVVRILGDARPAFNEFTVEPLADFDSATTGPRLAQPTDIEKSYSQRANEITGGFGTIGEQVARLAQTLHEEYTLNSSDPGGVQQNLIDRFLRDSKVGNKEQFITGFVLLARSFGVDARIATGYLLDAHAPSAEITTADAAAWAEVRVASGWVDVDVLPEDSTVPEILENQSGRAVTPPAAQPLQPSAVDQADADEDTDTAVPPADPGPWASVRLWALRVAIGSGVLMCPLVVFAAVVMWKKVRRRKGLKASDPAKRVSTAWVLATDALVDAGVTLQSSQTNAELVEAGVTSQPGAGAPLGRLQRHADAVMFTTAACDPTRATDAVAQLRAIEESIRSSSSRWWQLKWRLSTRSLRRRTKSPLR